MAARAAVTIRTVEGEIIANLNSHSHTLQVIYDSGHVRRHLENGACGHLFYSVDCCRLDNIDGPALHFQASFEAGVSIVARKLARMTQKLNGSLFVLTP